MISLTNAIARLLRRNTAGARSAGENGEYQLYEYRRADGSFDYDKYRRIQTGGNWRKLDKVWARKDNIAFLSSYIRSVVRDPARGLCHGTRRGLEQAWFHEFLDCDVVGTEISDSADQFPMTICWDFHETKPEWIDSIDFIYSNSLDHSYDPERCLNAWMSCIRGNGVCIIEHTSGHEEACQLDPFGAKWPDILDLISGWGKGRYFIRETLDAPYVADGLSYAKFIVLQRQESMPSDHDPQTVPGA